MAVTFVQGNHAAFGTRSNTSISISSTSPNDFIVALMSCARTAIVTLPGGFTDITLMPDVPSDILTHPINDWSLHAYYKKSSGGDTAVTFNHASMPCMAWVGVYRGVDTTTPIDGNVVYVRNSTTQTVSIPSYTFTTDGLGIVVGNTWDPYPATSPPSGHTERLDIAPTNSTLYVADKVWGAGATGNISLSMDPDDAFDDRVACMIPLRAASGGAASGNVYVGFVPILS